MNSAVVEIKGQLVKAGITNERIAAQYAESLVNEGFDCREALLIAEDSDFKECQIKTGHKKLIKKFLAKSEKQSTGRSTQSSGKVAAANATSVKVTYPSILEATENLCEQRKLGSGTFAVVYLGDTNLITDNDPFCRKQIKEWPAKVAVKVASEKSGKGGNLTAWMAAADESELFVLSKYSHRNICCLLGYSTDGPTRCLIFELCTGGDLQARLEGTAIDPNTKAPYPPLTAAHRIIIFAD